MAQTATVEEQVKLTDADYELLRAATETYREELLIRLCGEAGLKTAEIPDIRPADLSRPQSGHEGTFLQVGDGDPREAFLPAEVAHDCRQYIRSNDIASDESIIQVSPRRVQMLIKTVGQRAANQHDRPGLADISPSALRRLFARRLLVTNGVDANVVCAVGGWERLDGLFEGPETTTRERIAEAFNTLSADSTTDGGRLRAVIDAMATVGTELGEAGSREGITRRVCEGLTTNEVYEAAWFLVPERHRQDVSTLAHAGDSPGRFQGANDSTLVRQARQTGAPMVAPDSPGPAGDQPGRGLLAAIPIEDGENAYGILVLRSTNPDAFSDPERMALEDLGRRIAFAITAIKRRHLLSGDSVVRLALGYSDREAVFVDLSATHACSVEIEGVVPAEAGTIVSFVRVQGAQPGQVLEQVDTHETVHDARIIRSYETETLLEVVLDEASPVGICVTHGGTITELAVENAQATLVGEFPPGLDVRSVVDTLGDRYPSVTLHRKQERAEPAESGLGLKRALEEELTDKQRSVLRGAYHAGYFEWPRGSTAEELADSMGVSSPTLHNHLRRAQQKLVGTALDDG